MQQASAIDMMLEVLSQNHVKAVWLTCGCPVITYLRHRWWYGIKATITFTNGCEVQTSGGTHRCWLGSTSAPLVRNEGFDKSHCV